MVRAEGLDWDCDELAKFLGDVWCDEDVEVAADTFAWLHVEAHSVGLAAGEVDCDKFSFV